MAGQEMETLSALLLIYLVELRLKIHRELFAM